MESTLIGTDGQAKMSKSLDNAIYLSDSPEEVERKVARMYTDPKRIKADVPGRVEGNPVFIYHDVFNRNQDEVQDLKSRYLEGKVGDVEVKEKLAVAINQFLDPLRERRLEFTCQPGIVLDILSEGSKKMEEESQETLTLVREAMGLQQYQSIYSLDETFQQPSRVLGGLAFM
jgi:tryptophanyl-tRNA synthetase